MYVRVILGLTLGHGKLVSVFFVYQSGLNGVLIGICLVVCLLQMADAMLDQASFLAECRHLCL
jgi:hypothetical protein